ncbi:hypothetical protein NKI56_00060 [Mesorhizobium sp. M0622]|uniref:hypothetical protein n=1 Tax=unclassified Mesorhizobium TaxID=325217 RepID=UPI00333BECBE
MVEEKTISIGSAPGYRAALLKMADCGAASSLAQHFDDGRRLIGIALPGSVEGSALSRGLAAIGTSTA